MKTISHPDLGSVPMHWKFTQLGNVADVTKLAGYEFTKHIEYVEDGEIIALRSLNVVDGQLDLSNVKLITKAASDELPRSKLFFNDILLTYTGSKLGGAALVDANDKYHLAPNVCRLRANDDKDAYYIYLYLRSTRFANVLNNFKVGTGQPTVPMKNIRKIPIPWPPKAERMEIGRIYRCLNDKIGLNRQMNFTLESMAQTLFKSWFVDFDPVIDNALAAGNPIPEALHVKAKGRAFLNDKRKPLPKVIEKHFPSSFVFSEEIAGWIPDGWKVKPLDEIAHYQNGLALQKFRPENEDDFLPVVKIAQLRKGFADGEEKASTSIKPECIIDDGDVVFSWSGSLLVDIWCGGRAALNQHLFKVTSATYPKWYFYNYTKHYLEEFQRIAADKAVTMGHIKREHLSQAKCVVPTVEMLNACTPYVGGLLDRHVDLRKEDRCLETIRDTLLPKLLSGQIRISDAEKLVADVV